MSIKVLVILQRLQFPISGVHPRRQVVYSRVDSVPFLDLIFQEVGIIFHFFDEETVQTYRVVESHFNSGSARRTCFQLKLLSRYRHALQRFSRVLQFSFLCLVKFTKRNYLQKTFWMIMALCILALSSQVKMMFCGVTLSFNILITFKRTLISKELESGLKYQILEPT